MGRKPVKKVEAIETPATIKCLGCGKEQASSKYSDSQSILYRSIAKLPYCQSCKIDLYNKYVQEFTKKNYKNPEQKAVQRICMAFDLFYDDRIYQQALREYTKVINNTKRPASLISYYFKNRNLMQCKDDGSSYDASIFKEYDSVLEEERTMTVFHRKDEEKEQIVNKASEFFGEGFSDEDYLFLQKEYEDWTSRHECQTKAQEEIFKDICFNRLRNLKALRNGEDVKDISAAFDRMLNSGKLQPKQNHNETVADTQTFGTLIDKWETTRPVPEIDPELQDVDNIGLYLDVFFRGHLAKMMGLKNGLSNLYTKYMKQYTVERPEYELEENDEALFDVIFGEQLDNKQS